MLVCVLTSQYQLSLVSLSPTAVWEAETACLWPDCGHTRHARCEWSVVRSSHTTNNHATIQFTLWQTSTNCTCTCTLLCVCITQRCIVIHMCSPYTFTFKDRNTFHRFDKFNSKYNPIGNDVIIYYTGGSMYHTLLVSPSQERAGWERCSWRWIMTWVVATMPNLSRLAGYMPGEMMAGVMLWVYSFTCCNHDCELQSMCSKTD